MHLCSNAQASEPFRGRQGRYGAASNSDNFSDHLFFICHARDCSCGGLHMHAPVSASVSIFLGSCSSLADVKLDKRFALGQPCDSFSESSIISLHKFLCDLTISTYAVCDLISFSQIVRLIKAVMTNRLESQSKILLQQINPPLSSVTRF